jgi:Carboxypeptidase regulatory-like domain
MSFSGLSHPGFRPVLIQRMCFMPRASALRLFTFLTMAVLAGAFAIKPAGAQDQKGEPELRTVHGSVIDKAENPVPSSVVYLKNLKTQDVKTYIANDSGEYRFSGLDPNVDYEIHAEHNDVSSSVRTISSYDSRRDINLPLKLAHKKNDH